ncbi:PilZ domain-containing protein [Pseudidiomarina marina]|uniref:Pilus assembly protein PilZ n=1 Tax=Pseudidiomarina marina TaxID=502366 RepID=A0A432YJW5_9GAMM|nr:PilZ domain-containing protein [Pseudidiomarina marina]PHR63925.1 MAG: pilus assembly protein PilZ [Idiomarina sp.]RUO61244.1 pilus assembly protein PilZ [Pseudidiomarina marina]
MDTQTVAADAEAELPKKRIVLGTEAQLRRYYMPFIKGGGLFLTTDEPLKIGDAFLLEVRLFGEQNSVLVKCKVVWLAPSKPGRPEQQGVGVQFIDDKAMLKNMIESKLAAIGNTGTPTATM